MTELLNSQEESWATSKLKLLFDEARGLLEIRELYQEANEVIPDDWHIEVAAWRFKALGAYRYLLGLKKANAYMTLQAGAGGVDAAVWSERVCKMYLAFAKSHNIQTEIIEWQEREPCGIRSATILFKHPLAHAILKNEIGRHRLVHRSPFDKQNRRHTSFVAVEVWPQINMKNTALNLSDVEIQAFRASGPGGQHRNKVETAIRATHKPTGLQAVISAGRSQTSNKEAALTLLASRYQEYQDAENAKTEDSIKGDKVFTGFGPPRRSYILDSKMRIEDPCITYKENNPLAVLAGNLDKLLIKS